MTPKEFREVENVQELIRIGEGAGASDPRVYISEQIAMLTWQKAEIIKERDSGLLVIAHVEILSNLDRLITLNNTILGQLNVGASVDKEVLSEINSLWDQLWYLMEDKSLQKQEVLVDTLFHGAPVMSQKGFIVQPDNPTLQ